MSLLSLDSSFTVLVRAEADLLSMGGRVIFKHIPAHSGIPGNEQADEYAKYGAVYCFLSVVLLFRFWY